MRRLKTILAAAVIAWLIFAGYKIGSCEYANFELHEDLRDIASQGSARIGLSYPHSDDDIRNGIVRDAQAYGISLEPDQVTLERMSDPKDMRLRLSADYEVRVNLLVFSPTLHFTPTSDK